MLTVNIWHLRLFSPVMAEFGLAQKRLVSSKTFRWKWLGRLYWFFVAPEPSYGPGGVLFCEVVER